MCSSDLDNFTTQIQNYYTSNLSIGNIPTKAIIDDANINTQYKQLTQTIESTFAIQSIFKDIFSDTHYDLDTQTFIVDDQTALNTKVLEYLNSPTQTIDEKLYLAKVMQMQYGGLEFSKTEIINNIQNNITKELVKDIYKGSSVSLFQTTDINNTDDIIIASDENEIITTTDRSEERRVGKECRL